LPSILPQIVTTSQEEVLITLSDCEFAIRADEKNRERCYWNWKNYFAVDGTQWKDLTRNKLIGQNRHAAQFNIIGPKVDAMAGSLMQEETDLDWKPMDGIRNSLTESLKTGYYVDSEIANYPKNFEAVIRDALIYLGVLKVQMSDRHDPLFNIVMRRMEPGFVVFDPYWISDEDDECENAYEIFHLSAEEIMRRYDISNPLLEQEVLEHRKTGFRYYEQTRNPNELVLLMRKGHLHRVIEHHYMENLETTRLIGQRLDSTRYITFPITTDKAAKEHYMLTNHIDPFTILETPYTDRIHKLKTIAPDIVHDKCLEKGTSKTQIRRLPYIQLTANRAFGQNKGIVDDLVDIQQTINKRESKLTDLISVATGGGKLVNKDLFLDPKAMKRFLERANDPSYTEFVNGDEMVKGKTIEYINSAQYPAEIINQLMRMWDIVDRVSKVPAALEAISDNPNESGVLFERKLQVARVNTITLVNRIRDFMKKCAEAYYHQFQLAYNGPERTMSTSDGSRETVLNKRVYNPSNGKVYIQNRPDMMPRCHVIATESRSAPNRKIRDRAIFSELYNLSTQTNPEYASFFFELLLETMDLDEEHKQRLKEISALQKIRDKTKIQTEIANLISQSKQADFAGAQAQVGLQQLMAQLGQQPEVPTQQVPEDEVPQELPVEEASLPQGQEILELPMPADRV